MKSPNSEYPGRAPKNPEELMEIHKGLMITIVDKFHKKYPEFLEWDEKLAYVVMAMMRCIKTFDPSKGFKFASYAGDAAGYELHKYIKREMHHVKPGYRNSSDDWDMYVERHHFLPQVNGKGDIEETEIGRRVEAKLWKAERYVAGNSLNSVALKEKVEYILNALPEKYRPVFQLMIEKGLTQAEAFREANPGTCWQAWNNAYRVRLRHMKKELKDD